MSRWLQLRQLNSSNTWQLKCGGCTENPSWPPSTVSDFKHPFGSCLPTCCGCSFKSPPETGHPPKIMLQHPGSSVIPPESQGHVTALAQPPLTSTTSSPLRLAPSQGPAQLLYSILPALLTAPTDQPSSPARDFKGWLLRAKHPFYEWQIALSGHLGNRKFSRSQKRQFLKKERGQECRTLWAELVPGCS